jgi:nitrogen-specific signal transduction histidine kinase
MSGPGPWMARRPANPAPRPSATGARAPQRAETNAGSNATGGPATIVVAGVVHHLEGLQGLGQIQRARWGVLSPYAARWPADLVVVGRSSGGVDPVGVIAGLKDAESTGGIPVLHVAPPEQDCIDCRADVCLSDAPVPGQLARVARVLIELGEARASSGRATGLESRTQARSERLETLGRLTGGIGHELNNLLFVITGQIELARRKLSPDHQAFDRLAPALRAAERAAALNRELQALGRVSPADPGPVDLDEVMARLDPILQRLIGKDFRVEIHAGVGQERVWADVAAIEQLVLNLALDARDSIPGGGLLTIDTRDAPAAGDADHSGPPGRHVTLAVSAEGVGADSGARAESEGSGPGLAIARSIVLRHGGQLRLESPPGRGAAFRVYLPSLDGPAEG